eukprot:7380297-Prymnesium_polylepis.1
MIASSSAAVLSGRAVRNGCQLRGASRAMAAPLARHELAAHALPRPAAHAPPVAHLPSPLRGAHRQRRARAPRLLALSPWLGANRAACALDALALRVPQPLSAALLAASGEWTATAAASRQMAPRRKRVARRRGGAARE